MTLKPGVVLVVEDEPIGRKQLEAMLRQSGYAVGTAENGRKALELMQGRPFDVVLLDLLMPEMDGYQVLERMKADPSLRHIPAIVITSQDDVESAVRCIERGAADVLPKPFNPVILKARIQNSLEKKRLYDLQEAYTQQLDFENNRKSEELEQARQIQEGMLPAGPPELPHLDIAARQVTASEVGGDYYDFFQPSGGNLLAAIGDATGHGVPASLMVAMTKAVLSTTEGTNPVALLPRLNAALCRINLRDQINMALLLLEFLPPQDGVVAVRASGGGMPSPYLLHSDGTIDEQPIRGMPLGILKTVTYAPKEFRLNPGDSLLLASDGLSEMFDPHGETLGGDRLKASLQEMKGAGLSASDLLDRVQEIGNAWAGGAPLQDDLTLMAIRVRPA